MLEVLFTQDSKVKYLFCGDYIGRLRKNGGQENDLISSLMHQKS